MTEKLAPEKCIFCSVEDIDPEHWPYCSHMCVMAAEADNDLDRFIIHRAVKLADSPALRGLARQCWPKIQHDSKEAAETHVHALVSRCINKDLSLHIYECPHCGKWHVGHGKE